MDRFKIIEKIGKGSFSQVYKVQRKTDQKIYAFKKVKLMNNTKEINNTLNQVRLLASLKSEHIIAYKQAFIENKHLCIILQFASKFFIKDQGDLQKKIHHYKKIGRYFRDHEILQAIQHITCGLKILHEKNIIHRDIKPANIFISQGKYKIGDFNVSKFSKEGLALTQTGTPYYASPQVWREQAYNFKSDIWALGCVIYQMSTLRPPFQGNNFYELNKAIQECSYKRLSKKYPAKIRNVIEICLVVQSNERASYRQILAILDKDIVESNNQNQLWLDTIKYDGSFKQINYKLPPANYDQTKLKKKKKLGNYFAENNLIQELTQKKQKKFLYNQKINEYNSEQKNQQQQNQPQEALQKSNRIRQFISKNQYLNLIKKNSSNYMQKKIYKQNRKYNIFTLQKNNIQLYRQKNNMSELQQKQSNNNNNNISKQTEAKKQSQNLKSQSSIKKIQKALLNYQNNDISAQNLIKIRSKTEKYTGKNERKIENMIEKRQSFEFTPIKQQKNMGYVKLSSLKKRQSINKQYQRLSQYKQISNITKNIEKIQQSYINKIL